MRIDTDIDIDVADRDAFLENLKHVDALASDRKSRHTVGVYFQDIPYNPVYGTSTIDFKQAADLGYFKVDILNNSIYEGVKNDAHLDKLINKEPNWDLLMVRSIVESLAHIHRHFPIVYKLQPKSVEQLAMVIAIIRPAKSHLVDKSWDEIKKEVWIPPKNDEYYFKKSHSLAYAMSIKVQLNLLMEK